MSVSNEVNSFNSKPVSLWLYWTQKYAVSYLSLFPIYLAPDGVVMDRKRLQPGAHVIQSVESYSFSSGNSPLNFYMYLLHLLEKYYIWLSVSIARIFGGNNFPVFFPWFFLFPVNKRFAIAIVFSVSA